MVIPKGRWRRALLFAAGAPIVMIGAFAMAPKVLQLELRSRAGGAQSMLQEKVPVDKAALILCDIWDKHWCQGASERTDAIARKAAPVVELARKSGILVIHAPSDTMQYYAQAPQRLAIMKLPVAQPPAPLERTEPPLPIDDSDGGCETVNNPLPVNYRAWSRQHPAIQVAPNDFISDNGREVYSALKQRGITTLFVAGVHTNMCILNRTFAIRQMTKWGIRCILIRDLTDAMYNPARRPFVSHYEGTQLVIQHIEKYWAPTITSTQLVRALQEK